MKKPQKLVSQEYNLSFLSPAFLGNAEQKGQFRTPPFKALLREWWRVAVAPSQMYDWKKILAREQDLFGSVRGASGGTQSHVRLRLKGWDAGHMTELSHVLIERVAGMNPPFVPGLYLGYGPITNQEKVVKIKQPPAIADGEKLNLLTVMYPADYQDEIERALRLVQAFGTLGGRSHNGWGSLDLAPPDGSRWLWSSCLPEEFSKMLRPLDECLGSDWPAAIAKDAKGPLIWRVDAEPKPNESDQKKDVLKKLSLLRQRLNKKAREKDYSGVTGRALLSLPVANAKGAEGSMGNDGRLPSSLRFKVVRFEAEEGKGRRVGAIVYHMPFNVNVQEKLPLLNAVAKGQQMEFWTIIHELLDKDHVRIGGGQLG